MMVALVPMCYTACGSDDDDDATGVAGVESFYGVWQQTHGAAWEDDAWHHDNDVNAEEAEYLNFDANGTCGVYGSFRGVFGNISGNFPYTFNEQTKALRIGNYSLTVEVLSSGTLKLKCFTGMGDDFILATYKKVNPSVWDNF